MAQTPGQQPASSKNKMTFVFSDGSSPVAAADLKVIALGKKSAAPRLSDLDNDMELTGRMKTDQDGALALDDPRLGAGFDLVGQVVKRNHPNKTHWDGVPGLPVPGAGWTVSPPPGSSYVYPNVPIVVHLIDATFDPSPVVADFAPGQVVTPWDRPPVGEIEDQQFKSTCDYLEYLALRFSYLGNLRPPHIPFANNRVGTNSPLESVFGQLDLRLHPAALRNSKDAQAIAAKREKTPAAVYRELSRELALPAGNDLPAGYLAALRLIKRIGCQELARGAGWSHMTLLRLTRALGRGVDKDLDRAAVVSPYEDYACLGAAVFLVGLMAQGYRFGSVDWAWNWSKWRLEATLSTTLACSQSESYPHCELMRP